MNGKGILSDEAGQKIQSDVEKQGKLVDGVSRGVAIQPAIET
jgi:hypothetical protein